MPATKKKKTKKKIVRKVVKNPPKADQLRAGNQGRMSEEMMNAMMMLFAGGMIVLAYVLYVSYI